MRKAFYSKTRAKSFVFDLATDYTKISSLNCIPSNDKKKIF